MLDLGQSQAQLLESDDAVEQRQLARGVAQPRHDLGLAAHKPMLVGLPGALLFVLEHHHDLHLVLAVRKLSQHDVVRLHVAVNHAQLVGVVEGVGRLQGEELVLQYDAGGEQRCEHDRERLAVLAPEVALGSDDLPRGADERIVGKVATEGEELADSTDNSRLSEAFGRCGAARATVLATASGLTLEDASVRSASVKDWRQRGWKIAQNVPTVFAIGR